MNTNVNGSKLRPRGRLKGSLKSDGPSGATVNATIRIEPEYWEALDSKARSMGMSRTQFLREIARGYIESQKALTTQEKEILGKYLAS